MINLLIDGLACYRLTRLITTDAIFATPRDELLGALYRNGHPAALKLAEGLECPWCVSIWVAGAITLTRRERGWARIRRGLAVAAIAGLVADHEHASAPRGTLDR